MHRRLVPPAIAALTSLMLVGCTPDNTGPVDNTGSVKLATSPTMSVGSASASNSYLILGKGNKLPSGLAAGIGLAGGTLTGSVSAIGVATATSSSPDFQTKASAIVGVEAVALDQVVEWIDPNEQVIEAEGIGDDERFFPGLQWAPKAIHAPEAWDLGATGAGVRVAVLDGGLNSNHQDLAGSVDVARSTSFVTGFAFNQDIGAPNAFSHATHVAGIVAAQDDGLGTIGVAPGATIIGVKVLHGGSGSFGAVIQGIAYAATPISQGGAGADIINMSLGGDFDLQSRNAAILASAMSRATTYAYQRGVTVIASAGNDAFDLDHTNNLISVPAQSANVITVSATGPFGLFTPAGSDPDRPASYTNFGQSAIDFAAPGGDFVFPSGPVCTLSLVNPPGSLTRPCFVFDLVISPGTLVNTNGYFFAAGTSMAAPHVAGVAALIIEKNGGSMHPAQVEAALRRSADDLGKTGNDDFYGRGRVNALRAVQ